MITVLFHNIVFDKGIDFPCKQGTKISMMIEGHAGAGKKGEDIICSAVSAVSQSAVLSISRIADVEQDIEQKQGYLRTEIDTSSLDSVRIERLKVILGTCMIGLHEIKKQYPEFMTIAFA